MTDVIWYDQARGNWDSGLLCSIFDKHPDKFRQHNTKVQVVFDKAIVILVNKPNVSNVRNYLEKFKQALVILTSDEDSYFDWKAAIPDRHEVWTQYYAPNKTEIKTRLLLGAPSRIKDFKTSALERKYLWSFVGQVQNPHRQACIEVLKELPDGYLKVVEGFSGTLGGEVEYQEYLDIMRQSKYVICPSGSMCCDSFRVYEAMECGAIPISDKRCPRDSQDFNYWEQVEPKRQILEVNDWETLNADNLKLFSNIDAWSWWWHYKNELEQKILSW